MVITFFAMLHHMSLSQRSNITLLLFLVVLPLGVVQSQATGDQERLLLLPFEVRGLAANEGSQLKQKFGEILGESGRFDVMQDHVLRNNLDLAGLANIDSCNTLPCLAQLGKVLDVAKVVHISLDQWRERYVMHIRLVRSSDATLLYAERVEFTGSYDELLSTVITEQARKLSAAYLDRRTSWYLIAAAVIVGIGLIYWIYSSFSPATPDNNGMPGPTPAPQ